MLSTEIDRLWATEGPLPEGAFETVMSVLKALNCGDLCVVEKQEGYWIVHEWIKRAILLSFRCLPMCVMPGPSFDRVPLRHQDYDEQAFLKEGIRVTPGAVVREGVYLGPSSVVMMSFVNIGAHIGARSMVDMLSTIGSCAYVGAGVHISSQVTLGGVIEPIQARPVIIEDNAFIGAGAQVLEGVLVGEGAVIAPGVHLTQSTKIYTPETKTISYGVIPPGAVVVPGCLPRDSGDYALSCAVIIKTVQPELRKKLSINELLRQH